MGFGFNTVLQHEDTNTDGGSKSRVVVTRAGQVVVSVHSLICTLQARAG